jgi:simple sugar transport system permease protein
MDRRKLWELLPRLTPVAAVILALLVGAIMLIALGTNPWVAYKALFVGAFGSTNALADTIVKATPLLFVGLGICIAFRGGVINIGGEGQLVAGAVAATAVGLAIPNWPGWIIIIIGLLVGALAGALWGGLAGFLKAQFHVNEILSTIMLNYIAVFGMNYLLRGPMMDPLQAKLGSFIPQTARLPRTADLPRLIPTRLHLGAAIAVVLAVIVYILLWRTTIGFRIRTVGKNLRAALGAGINVKKYMVLSLLLAGALAGLGGAVEVLGLHHRMFTDGSAFGFTGSAGFNGIVTALFGQLHPIGTIPSSFFLGALLTGANKMQRVVQIPSALFKALNGLIVLLVVGSEIIRRRQTRRIGKEAPIAKMESKVKEE